LTFFVVGWVGFPSELYSQSIQQSPSNTKSIRVATLNSSLYREESGVLLAELESGNSEQAQQLARILQTVRPDILLLNEVDYDADGRVAKSLRDRYFRVSQGLENSMGLDFPHFYSAPVNTGLPSGMDLDLNGEIDDPADAWGFGKYPGQYGMVLYSNFPINTELVRTFQHFLWSKMPNALQPRVPETKAAYYSSETWERLRLSSKSHWDVPINVHGKTLHILASHPTPPVFDGPEDRNGCRNHDEVRMWLDYITPGTGEYLLDDQGKPGGLGANALFVLLGDLNSDPADGAGPREAILGLLNHQRVQDPQQASEGAAEQSGKNRQHQGEAKLDTADFGSQNMRVDFVLPSKELRLIDQGVFWPKQSDPRSKWLSATDHRLVWVTIGIP
jgi:endonuclease/exonuclease/phosphatase family metal-dependent hydrolase